MNIFKTHLGLLTVLTLVLCGVVFILNSVWPGPWIHAKIWWIILFYSILTGVTGMISIHLLKKDKLNFASTILGSAVFRLIFSLAFVFIVLWAGDENILWFVVNFFAIYLLYLLFDIYSLITNLRLHLK